MATSPRRKLRSAAVIAVGALLLIGGTLVERAGRNTGCDHGERDILMRLTPARGAEVTVSEDDFKDSCVAQYHPRGHPPAEVLDHHAAQLTAQGWRVDGPFLPPLWDTPFLNARRGAYSVYIDMVSAGGEDTVRLSASYGG